jgi:hypothetical protein
MRHLTPAEAKAQGYQSISTGISPHGLKYSNIASREYLTAMITRYFEGMPESELVDALRGERDSKYGVTDAKIAASMEASMEGIDAVWIITTPSKWELGRKSHEVRMGDDEDSLTSTN